MSNKERGVYYEKKLKERLEHDHNASVERALPKTVWIASGRPISTHHDFYGIFDLIVFFPLDVEIYGRIIKTGEPLLIQVKFLGPKSHGWNADVAAGMKDFPCMHKALWVYKRKDNKTNEMVTWL